MTDETVLEEANRLIYGARQASYGHPFDDFSKTGQIWGAILSDWRKSDNPNVPPELVALCQIGVKISREVNATKRDNVVDIAGYAGTLQMVRERQAAPPKTRPLPDHECGLTPCNVRICEEPNCHGRAMHLVYAD